jgi:hypothetical protein
VVNQDELIHTSVFLPRTNQPSPKPLSMATARLKLSGDAGPIPFAPLRLWFRFHFILARQVGFASICEIRVLVSSCNEMRFGWLK